MDNKLLDFPMNPDYDYLLKEDSSQLSLFQDNVWDSVAAKYDIKAVRFGADVGIFQGHNDSKHTISRLCAKKIDADLEFVDSLKDSNFYAKENDQKMKYVEYNSTVNFYPEGIEIVKYPKSFKIVPQYNKQALNIRIQISKFSLELLISFRNSKSTTI